MVIPKPDMTATRVKAGIRTWRRLPDFTMGYAWPRVIHAIPPDGSCWFFAPGCRKEGLPYCATTMAAGSQRKTA